MNDELMQINEKRGPFYYIGIRVIRLLDLLDEREIKRGLLFGSNPHSIDLFSFSLFLGSN